MRGNGDGSGAMLFQTRGSHVVAREYRVLLTRVHGGPTLYPKRCAAAAFSHHLWWMYCSQCHISSRKSSASSEFRKTQTPVFGTSPSAVVLRTIAWKSVGASASAMSRRPSTT